ncbi:DUF2057 family protein [Marinobacter sp. F4216]|uniref:DUF2057 family protein n=1 Tax=Marinobacter sp. F4216 TaxID=2874281 RepID=UPI001CBF129C|nr:DUF2057 family protein [Marinobacter sp. F4216]MBZ2170123.1 DUF2057 domain-containing protein [Marinobacter sp. F4216]
MRTFSNPAVVRRPVWRPVHGARALLFALLALAITGCASSVSRVETWDGSPAGASDAATLKAPGEIQVSEVNGRRVGNFLMDDLALDYALLPGQNEVVFTYKTIWAKTEVVGNGESKVHVVESKPQVVRFDAQPNEVYTFLFDKPGTKVEAEQMMAGFSATVVGADGIAVAKSSERALDQVAARTPVPAATAAPVGGTDASALDTLKAVWETASEDEKKAFLRWAFE